MIVIGINDTHDASACIIKNGKLLEAVLEERFTRKKNISSFPANSIKYLIKQHKIQPEQINAVAVATLKLYHMNLWNIGADFTIEDWQKIENDYYQQRIYNSKNIKLRQVFKKYKPSVKLGYSLKKIPFISSDEAKKKIMK